MINVTFVELTILLVAVTGAAMAGVGAGSTVRARAYREGRQDAQDDARLALGDRTGRYDLDDDEAEEEPAVEEEPEPEPAPMWTEPGQSSGRHAADAVARRLLAEDAPDEVDESALPDWERALLHREFVERRRWPSEGDTERFAAVADEGTRRGIAEDVGFERTADAADGAR